MDPPTPPGLGSAVAEASTAAIPAAAAGPSRLLATAHKHNHPSYYDMIFAAVSALKSATGPSTKMISDYIQQNYHDLPPNHSALLTHHLDSMTESGRIVVSQNSYRVPETEGSDHTKRGRPAKSKAAPDPARELGLSDDKARKTGEVAELGLRKRGRGRGRGRGRPAKARGRGPVEEAAPQGTPKRARGRPPKVTMVPFASEDADAQTGIGHQDQPKVAVGYAGKSPVRQRGRPSRSNATTTAPADQPNQSVPSAAPVAAMHVHGLEYQILQKKVEIIQEKIKDAVAVLKAHFGEGSDNVMSAIRELEAIAAMDMKAFQLADSS